MTALNKAENVTMPQWFENHYVCSDCTMTWTDEWSCTCNDRCPECDAETEPSFSLDLSRQLIKEDYIGAARLLRDQQNLTSATVTNEDARDYAEALLEGGDYRFAVRRA
jgi:hypothetical protein